MSKSNTFENELLRFYLNNEVPSGGLLADLGIAAAGTPGSLYLTLHDAVPNDAYTQDLNEADYTGYGGRVELIRSTVSPEWSITNNVAETTNTHVFGTNNSGSNVTIRGFSLGTEATAGVSGPILYYGALALEQSRTFTADTSDVFTSAGHGLNVNDQIIVYAFGSGSLPTGVSNATYYWIISTPSSDTFTVSTTEGGSAVDVTANGSGRMAKALELVVGAGSEPRLNAGAVKVYED